MALWQWTMKWPSGSTKLEETCCELVTLSGSSEPRSIGAACLPKPSSNALTIFCAEGTMTLLPNAKYVFRPTGKAATSLLDKPMYVPAQLTLSQHAHTAIDLHHVGAIWHALSALVAAAVWPVG